MSLSSFRRHFRPCDCSFFVLNFEQLIGLSKFKAKVPTRLLSLSSMTHISCTRPDTTGPWSAQAKFPELFYQRRAGGFSGGREQHIARHTSQLPLVHVSVSVSARELGVQPWPLVSSSAPPKLRLKTCCYRPAGVLGSDNGKTRLQMWPALQEHQPSIWTPKPVGSQRRCNTENFHSPVKFLTGSVTNTLNLKLSRCYLFSHPPHVLKTPELFPQ